MQNHTILIFTDTTIHLELKPCLVGQIVQVGSYDNIILKREQKFDLIFYFIFSEINQVTAYNFFFF